MSRLGKPYTFWQVVGMAGPSLKPFVEILVEPHDALPDGCALRYKAESAVRQVARVRYEPDDGPDAVWQVAGQDAGGRMTTARAVQVEDSGAGTSWLIWGDAFGLRLRHGDTVVAETHLLLALDQIVD